MDLSGSIQPKSDQLDYDDFLSGPKTLTVTEVRPGPSSEQPVEVVFAEADRPWRPAKTMRRVLVAAWGVDTNTYGGRRVTLFGDPTVKWGGLPVGGIRVSHLSHIEHRLTLSLTVTRGKKAPWVVEPLSDDVSTRHASPGEGITPEHEAAIRTHMVRTGITAADVLDTARNISRRDVTTARDLTALEADGVVAHLADLPDKPSDDGDPSFPGEEA